MAPNQSRQILVWSLPTIAVLLSYFWYRRKRTGVLRDPGKTKLTSKEEILDGYNETEKVLGSSISSPQQIVSNTVAEGVQSTPTRSFGRSLSGVESTPIDIIIPRELRSSRSVAIVISDEDLDFEIEKVKSMQSSNPIEEFQKVRKANESIEANNNFEEVQPYNSISSATSPTTESKISKIEMAPLDRKKRSSGNGNQPIIKRGNQSIVRKNDDDTHSSAGPSTNGIPPKTKQVVKAEKPLSSGIKPESANIAKIKTNNGETACASTTPVKTPVVAKGMKIDAKPFVCKNTTPTKINSVCSAKSAPKKQKNKKKDTEQKNSSVVEEKQNDKVAKKKNTEKNKKSNSIQEEPHRQNGERDSANHSPDQAMMASHSPSSMSDNHSERSNDSGNGYSDSTTPPPPPETPENAETPEIPETPEKAETPEAAETPETAETSETEPADPKTTHEFEIPQNLVGKLIGKKGNFVSLIHHRTGAKVVAAKHPIEENMSICTVKGTLAEIEEALQMIRGRFPLDIFPQVTLESIDILTHSVPSIDHLHLKLVAGINNDTVVSCMVSPGHLFLQQPTHPTFPGLQVLTNCMNHHYSTMDSPLLSPIPVNTICAAYSVDSWYRAMILETDEESETTYVKFVDYGGFAYVQNCMLRQMRYDFTMLPFQAAECFLANVIPSEGTWADEAYNLISDLTKGCLVFAQVIEYAEDDTTPLVHCYAVHGPHKLIFLNQELVKRGYAEWVSLEDDENCGTSEIVPVDSAHEV